MRKFLTKIFWNIELWAVQKHVNLVDLVKGFPTNIYLQNLASIQKRTSLSKFAHFAEKSGNGSTSNLSTKVRRPSLHTKPHCRRREHRGERRGDAPACCSNKSLQICWHNEEKFIRSGRWRDDDTPDIASYVCFQFLNARFWSKCKCLPSPGTWLARCRTRAESDAGNASDLLSIFKFSKPIFSCWW